MSGEEEILYKILLSREKRAQKQKYLINEYKCSLISFTLNIPGPVKDGFIYKKIHGEGIKEILKRINDEGLDIVYREESYEETGAEAFVCVNTEGLKVKRITVDIEENHKLGRIFDFDVFDRNFKAISRKEISLNERKCLLCNEKALICKRKKKHKTEELLKKIDMMASEFFSDQPS
jgi:holo-ACP synthase